MIWNSSISSSQLHWSIWTRSNTKQNHLSFPRTSNNNTLTNAEWAAADESRSICCDLKATEKQRTFQCSSLFEYLYSTVDFSFFSARATQYSRWCAGARWKRERYCCFVAPHSQISARSARTLEIAIWRHPGGRLLSQSNLSVFGVIACRTIAAQIQRLLLRFVTAGSEGEQHRRIEYVVGDWQSKRNTMK